MKIVVLGDYKTRVYRKNLSYQVTFLKGIEQIKDGKLTLQEGSYVGDKKYSTTIINV